MALSSDQGPIGTLSSLALSLRSLKSDVFQTWMDRVRETLPHAKDLSEPVLANTLPIFFEDLLQALSPEYLRPIADVASTTLPIEHGNVRARLTGYSIDEVIDEYHLLKAVILETLHSRGIVLEPMDIQTLSSVFDASIKEAATGFVLTQTIFRERFAASLMHDLKSPLSTALLIGELLERNMSSSNHLLSRLKSTLNRMDQMMNQVLDVIVFQSGERLQLMIENMDFFEVVNALFNNNDYSPQKIEIAGHHINGWWSRDALLRAMDDLVRTATKFGAADQPISISWEESHQRLLISIHNSECVISAAEIESIFNVYERALQDKEVREKWELGIGLSYVRSVAEAHGGSISAESAELRGTTFIFNIPLDARPFQASDVSEMNISH